MAKPTQLTGKLLIAMPDIGDDRFERSVILLCAHSEDHAMGIVLNKTFEGLNLSELLDQLDVPIEISLPEKPILFGGPVGKDRGFVLHSSDYRSDGATIEVSDDLGLTATREALHAIASPNAPRRSVLALGYAGWGPCQLEAELAENVWLLVDADEDLIFSSDVHDKWEKALNKLGITVGQLQLGTGNA